MFDSTKNEQKKTCVKLCFIDCKFLALSLEKLASIKINWKLYGQNFLISARRIDLLMRIFLYKYIDCVEKLEETELLSRDSFYNSLMVESDHAHRQRVAAVLHSNARWI